MCYRYSNLVVINFLLLKQRSFIIMVIIINAEAVSYKQQFFMQSSILKITNNFTSLQYCSFFARAITSARASTRVNLRCTHF